MDAGVWSWNSRITDQGLPTANRVWWRASHVVAAWGWACGAPSDSWTKCKFRPRLAKAQPSSSENGGQAEYMNQADEKKLSITGASDVIRAQQTARKMA